MKKTTATPTQATRARARRAFGDHLREWLHDRKHAAAKKRAKAAKKRAADIKKGRVPSRGVDRVPDRYRGPAKQDPTYLHQFFGTVKSHHKPYVNPDRDTKSAKAGRLRKDLLP